MDNNSGEVTLSTVLLGDVQIYYLISNNENAQFTYTDGIPTNGTLYDPDHKPTLGNGQYIKAVALITYHVSALPAVATKTATP